jgi:hypothetical protein
MGKKRTFGKVLERVGKAGKSASGKLGAGARAPSRRPK